MTSVKIGEDQSMKINRRRSIGEDQWEKFNRRRVIGEINRRRSATSMVQNNFDFKRISIILLYILRVGDFGTKTKNNVSKKYLYAIYGFLEKSNGWRFDFRGPNYFDKGV